MTKRWERSELGRLVEVHRPMHPAIGWTAVLALPVTFAVLAVFTPGTVPGLIVSTVIAVAFAYITSLMLFSQQRFYEHGVVLKTLPLPGCPVYVIPYYTVDPATIEVGGRVRHDGTYRAGVAMARAERYQVSSLVRGSVWFTAVPPKVARHQLGKGRIAWFDAYAETPNAARWAIADRRAERRRELFAHAVATSQLDHPYRPSPDHTPPPPDPWG